MKKLRRYKVFGQTVKACDAGCADGFREDRKHSLIYPPVRDPETGELVSWPKASVKYGFCVYCGK